MQIHNSNTNHGVGFVGLLTIVFITLKLIGVIDWSWWWVLSPIWITVLLWVSILAGFIFMAYRDFNRKK